MNPPQRDLLGVLHPLPLVQLGVAFVVLVFALGDTYHNRQVGNRERVARAPYHDLWQ